MSCAKSPAPVRHADGAVLGQNGPLLVQWQLREPAAAPQRIPHRPGPRLIEHRPPRAVQQDVGQVGLVAERVRAAEHRVFRLLVENGERAGVDERAHAVDEVRRIPIEGQEADAPRIVDVFVQDARDPRLAERERERPGVGAPAEGEELHEQPLVGALGRALLHPAFFAQIRRLGSSARVRGRRAHG
jgi:hypothetical protein